MLAKKSLGAAPAAEAIYVEDVYSTYLHTGNGSTQTITNGVDLSGEGGLVWIKSRSNAQDHQLFDTERGATKELISNSTAAEATDADTLTAFNADGFSLGADANVNTNAYTYASFTFRKAKKFFDVVTYTGNGTAGRTISHNLGSVPGCIIVKNLTTSGTGWIVYHRSLGSTKILELNTTAAEQTQNEWNDTDPTSTVFSVYNGYGTNRNGDSYVAYLFAHDAGGFGDAGDQSVIKCGSFTTDGSGNATVTLDWEPQWLMVKASSTSQNWYIEDNMRAFNLTSRAILFPSLSNAEATGTTAYLAPNSTGFAAVNGQLSASQTYIYIAIRRGPMKTPEAGTSVFKPVTRTRNGTATTTTGVGFTPDFWMTKPRSADWSPIYDRLRGYAFQLYTHSTNAEKDTSALSVFSGFDTMDGVRIGNDPSNWYTNNGAANQIDYYIRRAPGFFDVVCYTGNNSSGESLDVTHNLGVAPELWIIKARNDTRAWIVGSTSLTNQEYLNLNTNSAKLSDKPSIWGSTATYPTSTYFRVGSVNNVNYYTYNFVAYLFASVSGVSKIGTYTGNGSSVTVTTDFQPRFIMVKRTDSTGNWIVGDSARGLVSADEPALFLNSTAAETTGQDWVDVSSTGFTVNETALNANVNTATYIYLCVA